MTTELEREGYIPPQKLIPTNKVIWNEKMTEKEIFILRKTKG